MSKKTREFQFYFSDHSKWEEELRKSKEEGSILVVDAHSTWSGPCKVIVSTFQKLFLEYSSDYNIKFCVMDCEKILSTLAASGDSSKSEEGDLNDDCRRDRYTVLLQEIAGKSQPQFLFYANGKFKRKIVGVNTPLIIKTINKIIGNVGKNDKEITEMTDTEDEDENEKKGEGNEKNNVENEEDREESNDNKEGEGESYKDTGGKMKEEEQGKDEGKGERYENTGDKREDGEEEEKGSDNTRDNKEEGTKEGETEESNDAGSDKRKEEEEVNRGESVVEGDDKEVGTNEENESTPNDTKESDEAKSAGSSEVKQDIVDGKNLNDEERIDEKVNEDVADDKVAEVVEVKVKNEEPEKGEKTEIVPEPRFQ